MLLYGTQTAAMRSLAGHLLADAAGPALLLDVAALATRPAEELNVILRALERDGRVNTTPLVLDATGDPPRARPWTT
ncbi:hypothetical protein [Deinococcus multiflagellatus]|uniref:Uncharacterized protein n=1 Tax=Deinococcus multiflagellatus TaxID=1656887 RepID=A0ABW1ZSD7_9DEIO